MNVEPKNIANMKQLKKEAVFSVVLVVLGFVLLQNFKNGIFGAFFVGIGTAYLFNVLDGLNQQTRVKDHIFLMSTQKLNGVISIYVGDKPYEEFLSTISESIGDKKIAGEFSRSVFNFDQMNIAMDDQQKENLKMCIRKLACYF